MRKVYETKNKNANLRRFYQETGMHTYTVRETPIGDITLEEDGESLTRLSFGRKAPPDAENRLTPLLRKAADQLLEYFSGRRTAFDLPLRAEGTPFQQAVWRALRAIPYGETRTYKDIATAVGNPKACRAVGLANRNNPLAIFVPCHRVVGTNGSLTGFAGGLDMKRRLLELERRP